MFTIQSEYPTGIFSVSTVEGRPAKSLAAGYHKESKIVRLSKGCRSQTDCRKRAVSAPCSQTRLEHWAPSPVVLTVPAQKLIAETKLPNSFKQNPAVADVNFPLGLYSLIEYFAIKRQLFLTDPGSNQKLQIFY